MPGILVGIGESLAAMMPHIPIGCLTGLVDGQVVEVVIERRFHVAGLELPHPDATTKDDRCLAVAQVPVRLWAGFPFE